jgi:hypothetical protein
MQTMSKHEQVTENFSTSNRMLEKMKAWCLRVFCRQQEQ